jgi:hypothetical protein
MFATESRGSAYARIPGHTVTPLIYDAVPTGEVTKRRIKQQANYQQ